MRERERVPADAEAAIVALTASAAALFPRRFLFQSALSFLGFILPSLSLSFQLRERERITITNHLISFSFCLRLSWREREREEEMRKHERAICANDCLLRDTKRGTGRRSGRQSRQRIPSVSRRITACVASRSLMMQWRWIKGVVSSPSSSCKQRGTRFSS